MRRYSIEHIGIGADDTEALAAWYAAKLGFKEFFRTATTPPTIFLEDEAGTKIEIFARAPGDRKPAFEDRTGVHIAFAVEDYEAAVAELESRGVSFIAPPKDIFAGGKTRFFADPEGNRLHIAWRPVKSW